jgi:uncharacterized protein YjbI with pentapeptide repeats
MTMHRRHFWVILFVGALAMTGQSRADIYQWEYVNSADPTQGKRQSTTPCPDGIGVSLAQNRDLSNHNLTMAYFDSGFLSQINFTGANLQRADLFAAFIQDTKLINADLSQADLRNAMFNRVDLSGANLSGALIQGAGGYTGVPLTSAQLYSTASYQSHDLHGTFLADSDFGGADFSNQNLTGAAIGNSNLNGASFRQANLNGAALGYSYYFGALPSMAVGADFSGANLTQANFVGSDLTGANLSGAQIRDADFSKFADTGIGGITPAQLYSTASYQAHDLGHIGLAGNNMTGADFSGLNLTDVDFSEARLTGANLSGAVIRGAYFRATVGLTPGQLYTTASYQSHDLSETDFEYLDLSGANLVGQNLTRCNFAGAKVTDADFSNANLTYARFDSGEYVGAPLTVVVEAKFTGANLSGADFTATDVSAVDFTSAIVKDASFYRGFPTPAGTGHTGDPVKDGVGGLTLAQLYSTASYQNHDLQGIGLGNNDLTGVNLSDQNLAGAYFAGAVLVGANLAHANLIRGSLSGAKIAGADFSNADLRGADIYAVDLTQATLTNTVRPDGHVAGLDLRAGGSLTIRDVDPISFEPPPGILIASYYYPAIPVVIDSHMKMEGGSTLRLLLQENAWDSVVSFQPGISVTLGGTLDLEFTSDTDVGAQVGRKIHLFDWSGVSPSGTFTIGGPYTWDASQLYTTGDVTLSAVPEPATAFTAAFGLAVVGGIAMSRKCRRGGCRF